MKIQGNQKAHESRQGSTLMGAVFGVAAALPT